MWQDYVMSIASMMFSYSLVPQVVKCLKDKYVQMPTQTIALTIAGLVLYNMCSYTLELYVSYTIGIFTTSCWIVLAILKWRYREQRTKNQAEEQSSSENPRKDLKKFEYNGHVYWIRPIGPNGDTHLQGKHSFQQGNKGH